MCTKKIERMGGREGRGGSGVMKKEGNGSVVFLRTNPLFFSTIY